MPSLRYGSSVRVCVLPSRLRRIYVRAGLFNLLHLSPSHQWQLHFHGEEIWKSDRPRLSANRGGARLVASNKPGEGTPHPSLSSSLLAPSSMRTRLFFLILPLLSMRFRNPWLATKRRRDLSQVNAFRNRANLGLAVYAHPRVGMLGTLPLSAVLTNRLG